MTNYAKIRLRNECYQELSQHSNILKLVKDLASRGKTDSYISKKLGITLDRVKEYKLCLDIIPKSRYYS